MLAPGVVLGAAESFCRTLFAGTMRRGSFTMKTAVPTLQHSETQGSSAPGLDLGCASGALN